LDTLWAPWRIEYILSNKTDGCFLCEAYARDPESDHETLILARGETFFSIMNRYPYNSGHILVTPIRHAANLTELTSEERVELMDCLTGHLEAIRAGLNPDGFNVGVNLGKVAGAGLEEHVHVHIVPRWAGDSNYMPVTGGTNVVPEALEATFARIRAHLSWPKG